jgi:hypothetical protein
MRTNSASLSDKSEGIEHRTAAKPAVFTLRNHLGVGVGGIWGSSGVEKRGTANRDSGVEPVPKLMTDGRPGLAVAETAQLSFPFERH